MQSITLKIDDSVSDKFLLLLKQFDRNEIAIIDKEEYRDDDKYLRSIDGVAESIKKAREEPIENGVTLDELDW